jgi:hypothetical protein
MILGLGGSLEGLARGTGKASTRPSCQAEAGPMLVDVTQKQGKRVRSRNERGRRERG